MTTYSAIANSLIDQDSPVTVSLQTAMRDNPIAIAEGAANAPVLSSGWHPYDMVLAGDGANGYLYEHGDSSTTNTVSFTPAVGYDYMLVLEGISFTSGPWDVNFALTGTSTSQKTTPIYSGMNGGDKLSGVIELFNPGLTQRNHFFNYQARLNTGTAGISTAGVAGRVLQYADNEAIATVAIGNEAGNNFDAGDIRLLRRRNYWGS